MRNGTFGIEMEGRTDKWTVKFFEVLLSFSLTNAYVVYRALHGDELTRGEFTNQVFEELFNNTNTPSYMISQELESLGYPYSYNLTEKKILNSLEEGLLDSSKSIRAILWNSLSIVSTLITAE
jgi:hypothetical protein